MLLRCAEPRRRLAGARSPLSAPAAGGRGAPRDRARPRAGGARAKRPSPRCASHHIGLRPSSTTAAARGSPVGPATPPEIERQAGARSLAFLFQFFPRAASSVGAPEPPPRLREADPLPRPPSQFRSQTPKFSRGGPDFFGRPPRNAGSSVFENSWIFGTLRGATIHLS